jgi:hypothetical protein
MTPKSELSAAAYTASDRAAWDEFVATGKNASFMFMRDYMEYHGDRFVDASVVIRRGETVQAVLPATSSDESTVVSHGGLTYGGLVVGRDASLNEVVESFGALLEHLAGESASTLIYKRIPGFYNSLPDSEIDHLAFLLGARTERLDVTAVVTQLDRLPRNNRRRRGERKAGQAGVEVREGLFDRFWNDVLEPRLADRYAAKPVHSLAEILVLAGRFPRSIRQYTVHVGDTVVAGATIYETPIVAKAQYIASTETGREIGALDFLFQWLLDERYQDRRFFDLGTSNNADGTINRTLFEWKEGFGARSYSFPTYAFDTESYRKLVA